MNLAQKQTLPHIVIVGAGFGGMEAAQKLAKTPVRITLIDRQNYHLFQPLLYQIAIAGLVPAQIAYPLRTIFRHQKNLTFQMGEVTAIDFDKRYVKMDGSVIAYDYLILAMGGQTNFFGMRSIEQNGFQLKDIESAVDTRNHLLKMFEQASREVDESKRRALLTFSIVGAGPTGVETAGALAELITHVMAKDYPQLDVKEMRVLLIEAGGVVMPAYPDPLRKATFDLLRSKHVEILLNAKLTDYDGEKITLGNGDRIPTRTLIWTAGVRASELADQLGVKQAASSRVVTEATLQLPDHPEVFVIGDAAYLVNLKMPAFADARNGCATGSQSRSEKYPENVKGRIAGSISLQRPRLAGNDWTQRGGGAHWRLVVPRIYRMGDLGGASHLSLDRFSQPVGGADQLGVGLFLLR